MTTRKDTAKGPARAVWSAAGVVLLLCLLLYLRQLTSSASVEEWSPFLGVLVALGLLASLAVSGLTWLARVAWQRLRAAEAVNHQLADQIRERRETESALRKSEARFRALFEDSPDAILVQDLDGRVLDANAAAGRLHGRDRADLIGRPLSELVPPDELDAVRRHFPRLCAGELESIEGRAWTSDGRAVPIEIHCRRIDYAGRTALLLHVRDVSDRKRLEAQLLQAQKMEAVGQLAGGIAHDFNNLLTIINGYCLLLEGGLPADHPCAPFVREIYVAGQRAADLTKQLSAYGRRQSLQPVVLDLNRLVTGVGRTLGRVVGEHVRVVTDLVADAPPVLADPGQLEQVLLNLAVNARDAMPEGGTLTFRTARDPLDAAAAARLGLAPANYVRLDVADTGCGMDAATQQRLFEPFFTTKGVGKGTGLGLATAYGIIKQSGGAIHVTSAPGHGTTFTIHLPQAGSRLPPPPAPAAPPSRGRDDSRLQLAAP